jgi:hypothetical protein
LVFPAPALRLEARDALADDALDDRPAAARLLAPCVRLADFARERVALAFGAAFRFAFAAGLLFLAEAAFFVFETAALVFGAVFLAGFEEAFAGAFFGAVLELIPDGARAGADLGSSGGSMVTCVILSTMTGASENSSSSPSASTSSASLSKELVRSSNSSKSSSSPIQYLIPSELMPSSSYRSPPTYDTLSGRVAHYAI